MKTKNEKRLLVFVLLLIGVFSSSTYTQQQKYNKLEIDYWDTYNRMHQLDYSLMICQFLRKKCNEKKCKEKK